MSAQYYFERAARENLDFIVLTDHAEDLSDSEWTEILYTAERISGQSKLVPFVGYEIAGYESMPTHTNVIFPEFKGKVFADEKAGQGERPRERRLPRDRVFKKISKYGPIALVAHPQRPDFLDSIGDNERRMIRGVEFFSTGYDASEPRCTYDQSIGPARRGLMLGAVAAGNDHFAQPGQSGLTAVLSKNRSRESIFEAINEGRTYAVRSERIRLNFEIEGSPMGSKLKRKARDGRCEFKLSVAARPECSHAFSIMQQPTCKVCSPECFPKCPRVRGLVVARVDQGEKEQVKLELGIEEAEFQSEEFRSPLKDGETGVYLARVLLEGFNEAHAVSSPISVQCVQ